MIKRTNSKQFLNDNFPELLEYKKTTSRMYEKKDSKRNRDNWWFKFSFADLENSEFIIFAGALDYLNKNFKIFKVPSVFIKDNLENLYMNKDGWIILYITFEEMIDIRNNKSILFKEFCIN